MCLERYLADSFCLHEWIKNKFQVGDNWSCPDEVREWLAAVLLALSWLHERCLAIGGFDLDGVALVPGPSIRIVFTDLACAVVGQSGRQYVESQRGSKPGSRSETFQPIQLAGRTEPTFTAISIQNVESTFANGRLDLLNTLDLDSLSSARFPVAICGRAKDQRSHETTALEHCRYADVEAAARNALLLFTGEKKFEESLLAVLKAATNKKEFAQGIDWPLETQQHTTVPRILELMRNLMHQDRTRRKSAQAAYASKAIQFPILTPEQTAQTINGGIPVPAGPCIPDKNGIMNLIAPSVALVHIEKIGLAVKAKQNMQRGDFVTNYAGDYLLDNDIPFSKHSLTLLRGLSHIVGLHNSQYTLDVYVRERSVGHLLNSSRVEHNISKPGNVRLDLERIYIDVQGNLRIPMFATKNILEGEELVWDYDFKAGSIGALLHESSDESSEDACVEHNFSYESSEGACLDLVLQLCS